MYVRPNLITRDLATAVASCQPVPGSYEWCLEKEGMWFKTPVGEDICFVPPWNPAQYFE